MVRRVCCVLIVLAVFLPCIPLLAQAGAGTLAGAVLDPDGKAVVAATLVIRNETTGETQTTATDASGHFSVGGLPAGSYAIEVLVPGFESVRRSAVQVAAEEQRKSR